MHLHMCLNRIFSAISLRFKEHFRQYCIYIECLNWMLHPQTTKYFTKHHYLLACSSMRKDWLILSLAKIPLQRKGKALVRLLARGNVMTQAWHYVDGNSTRRNGRIWNSENRAELNWLIEKHQQFKMHPLVMWNQARTSQLDALQMCRIISPIKCSQLGPMGRGWQDWGMHGLLVVINCKFDQPPSQYNLW